MNTDPAGWETERLAFAHAQLRDILLRRMPQEGVFASAMPDVGMARRDTAGFSEHRFDRPVVSLLVQGSKESVIGASRHRLEPGQILTVCLDMPSSSRILLATREAPLLTLYFYINPRTIRDLLLEMERWPGQGKQPPGVSVNRADADFMEAMLRLATVLGKPAHLPARAELALRDLHFLLLTGPQAAALQHVHAGGGCLFAAIAYMKAHLDRIVGAAELARAVNMSESSLYRQFRTFTGISPLQYHKQLRLHEARNLIMVEDERVTTAAFRVGFESVSQFGREYKKMFGIPPGRSKREG